MNVIQSILTAIADSPARQRHEPRRVRENRAPVTERSITARSRRAQTMCRGLKRAAWKGVAS